ncbi:hypothetical protein HD554DRAFT_1692103 [Boletus coccyginus]|nr:hypothetical protein HD554DRAFT_1692103 [Boletus coccyginus]
MPAIRSNRFGGGTSAFGGNGGSSSFGQPDSATAFGEDANPPLVRTGSSSQAYSVFSENDLSNRSTMVHYISITAAPAYRGASLEELRVQDYQQNRETAIQTPYIDPAKQSPARFESLFTAQQRAAGSISGDYANTDPPPVRTGTSTPAYSVFSDRHPSNLRAMLHYTSITTAPAYMSMSSEELRVQDYQQDRKTAPYIDLDMQSPTPFESLFTSQQRTAGLIRGDYPSTGALGATTTRPATVPFGVTGQQRPSTGTASVTPFWRAKPTTELGSTFDQPRKSLVTIHLTYFIAGRMFDPGKLARIEGLVIKSLLEESLVDTQFYLFSARSPKSARVTKPRVLCASNALLAKSSKYFLDLSSADINPSDPSLVGLTADNDVPSDARVDDYGYESDSDLEDSDATVPVTNPEAPKDQSAVLRGTPSNASAETRSKDDDRLPESGSGSVGSTTFVVNPEKPGMYYTSSANNGGPESVVGCAAGLLETVDSKKWCRKTTVPLRSPGSRHILVKDTAFQTWYTLLNYLHTEKMKFLPLSSTPTPGRHCESSMSFLDEPRCSAKSMYRLACKVGLDHLRDVALAHIRSGLSEHNILKELSCSLVSRHPQLLETELDMLYSYIASPPVVAGFPAFARRIANKEIPHGADIILGIHARLLKEPHRLPFAEVTLASLPGPLELTETVSRDLTASDASEEGADDE